MLRAGVSDGKDDGLLAQGELLPFAIWFNLLELALGIGYGDAH